MCTRFSLRNKKGFTIVELLISISILAILSGVTISVINFGQKRANARDAVRRSNIEKLAQSLEAYCAAEPTCAPNLADAVLTTTYVKAMPADTTYTYFVSGANFTVFATKASDANSCIKYCSEWGEIRECGIAGCGVAYSNTCP
jgi:prepilin-type N-terminal cleavage/methylation domain-containing protein